MGKDKRTLLYEVKSAKGFDPRQSRFFLFQVEKLKLSIDCARACLEPEIPNANMRL